MNCPHCGNAVQSEIAASDYEEVLSDHRRLVREIDVILNGEEGAAKQASLCDLLPQIKKLVTRPDDNGTRHSLHDLIHRALCEYRCKYWQEDQQGMALVDVFTPLDYHTIAPGKEEIDLLADFITSEIDKEPVSATRRTLPAANAEDAEGDWTLSFKFLEEVCDAAKMKNEGWQVMPEAAQAVILALVEMGYLVGTAPSKWNGKERRHTIDTAIGMDDRRGAVDSRGKSG